MYSLIGSLLLLVGLGGFLLVVALILLIVVLEVRQHSVGAEQATVHYVEEVVACNRRSAEGARFRSHERTTSYLASGTLLRLPEIVVVCGGRHVDLDVVEDGLQLLELFDDLLVDRRDLLLGATKDLGEESSLPSLD